jgi:hypothetical protein
VALPRRACCRGRALAVIAAALRGSGVPGGGARRCAARIRCCPAGTAVPGTRVRLSGHMVWLPPVAARFLHGGPGER